LANINEVEQGTLTLKDDIARGEFELIMAKYDNSMGDYLFITLQKC
jgi:hypothetical protein